MTEYDESKTTVDITDGNAVSRTCGKCNTDLKDGDRHLCARCLAASGMGLESAPIDGKKDKKKPPETEI